MGARRQIALAGPRGRCDGAGVLLSRLPDPSPRPHLTGDALEQHRPALTALCRRMLGSGPGAEDAVQETLLRAWRGGHRFEGRAQLGTWLSCIARNVCLDEIEVRARRPLAVAPLEEAGDDGAPRDIRDPDDPATLVERRETVRLACVVALRVLAPRQRAALVLCAVLRVRASEAAGLMGISTASVNSLLQRARATLVAAEAVPDAVDPVLGGDRDELLSRYVAALTSGDVQALVALALEELGPVPDAGGPALLAA